MDVLFVIGFIVLVSAVCAADFSPSQRYTYSEFDEPRNYQRMYEQGRKDNAEHKAYLKRQRRENSWFFKLFK